MDVPIKKLFKIACFKLSETRLVKKIEKVLKFKFSEFSLYTKDKLKKL